MPSRLRAALQNLRDKLQLTQPLDSLELQEQVIPVVPLNTFGFFSSLADAVSTTSAAGPGDVSTDQICPTAKVRRVIGCSVTGNAAAVFTRGEIFMINPANTVAAALAIMGSSPIDGTTNIIRVTREFLWPPGWTLRGQANFAGVSTIRLETVFFEEDAGIAPTG